MGVTSKERGTEMVGNLKFTNDSAAHCPRVATGSVARTDTAGKLLFSLPANAVLDGITVVGAGNADAGTTATLSIGKTLTGTDYVNGLNVKTSGAGQVVPASIAGSFGSVGSSAQPIYGSYAETGTGSSTGGPWVINVSYHL